MPSIIQIRFSGEMKYAKINDVFFKIRSNTYALYVILDTFSHPIYQLSSFIKYVQDKTLNIMPLL